MNKIAKTISDDPIKFLIIGGIVVYILPILLRNIASAAGNAAIETVKAGVTAAGEAAAGAFNAAQQTVNETLDTPITYVGGGASWGDLVGTFGMDCANAIVQGDSWGRMWYCPLGWQDKLIQLNASKGGTVSGLGENAYTLKRGKDGVYR